GCTFANVACTRDGTGWLVQDVTVQGSPSLHISSGAGVLFRHVHVRDAGDVRLDVTCACAVRGDDFTVDGGAGGGMVWLLVDGPVGAERELEGASIDGLAISNMERGLNIDTFVGALAISNLTVKCRTQGYGIGIEITDAARSSSVSIRDSRIEGCQDWGLIESETADTPPPPHVDVGLRRVEFTGNAIAVELRGHGYNLTVRDSTFAGNHIGITAVTRQDDPVLRLDIERTTFQGNGKHGLLGSGDCGGAIEGWFAGAVHNSTFTGNRPALNVRDSFFPGYQPMVDARANWWGLPAGPTFAVQCDNGGVVAGDPIYGIASTEPHLLAPP
ncbi:MAG: hypothetical protein LC620_03070, partial [Halobacteriales archaeon]|nr:hypothetical protein [Halobacteriales archaeon]